VRSYKQEEISVKLIEIAHLKVNEDQAKAFSESAALGLQIICDDDGCRGGSLYHCVERPSEFIFEIEWDSVDAHLRFRDTDRYQQFRATIIDYLAEAPTFAHYAQEAAGS
jgi:quinol monooxygenase YgiN